jgi:putative flippase GtrA
MSFYEKIFELPLFREFKKMASFGAIGAVNAVVDYAVFYLLVLFILTPNGWVNDNLPTSLVNFAAWSVAVSGSYVMNSKLTFRDHTGGTLSLKKYGHFALAGLAGLAVNTAVLLIAKAYMPLMLAKLLAIGCTFIVSFGVTRFFVFGKK